MPTPAEKPSPIANDHQGSEMGKPVASVTATPMLLPQRMPRMPPIEVSTAASDRNWNSTSWRRAPSAFRTPISRVRSVTEVRGHGKQKGHTAIYRGKEYNVSLLPKMEIEVVVADAVADDVVKAIVTAARTGEIGDGRVFVLPVLESYRIRTGEREA